MNSLCFARNNGRMIWNLCQRVHFSRLSLRNIETKSNLVSQLAIRNNHFSSKISQQYNVAYTSFR